MLSARVGIVVAEAKEGPNARRHGRIKVTDATSTIGKVLDISLTGMRAQCRTKPPETGSIVRVEITGLNCSAQVMARVVWGRKLGWFRYELGLEFQSPDEAARQCLLELARTAGNGEGLIR